MERSGNRIPSGVTEEVEVYLRALQNRQAELTDQVIFALSSAVEAKDRYTNGHSRRVADYSQEIVARMGWSVEQQRRVYDTGLLHDVGKIRVRDTIINKPDRLNEAEYSEMKLHTLAGYYILKEISSVSDFAIGARWHHERFDGSGYPNGLKGENIPLISRVIGVADAYDAMTSHRSYRGVLPQEKVRAEIQKGMGTQFDPAVAAIMLDMIDADKNYLMRQPDPPAERLILAVDDDPMVHKFLDFAFRSKPEYRLISATSGEDGIAKLAQKRADIVLLDVEMPGMDGFDVLSHIRSNYVGMPVIFMTGEKEMEIIQRAELMGINDYLTKPLIAHVLHESIQNVLLSPAYVELFKEPKKYGKK